VEKEDHQVFGKVSSPSDSFLIDARMRDGGRIVYLLHLPLSFLPFINIVTLDAVYRQLYINALNRC
jgi:hypothetical protein